MTRRPRHLPELERKSGTLRSLGFAARAFGVDARSEKETIALFETIEREIGPLEVVVFNIGANVRFPIRDTTARVFHKVWEMACFAGFLCGCEAARAHGPARPGRDPVHGRHGERARREGFSAFAAAKHGLRALAQSMARELGRQGVHVAHVVIDGAVDGVFTRSNSDDAETLLQRGEILDPKDIAAAYVALVAQGRSAWTHELDLRPWTEKW